jgi:hypothetical protein
MIPFAVAVLAAALHPGPADWQALERRGAVITEIRVEREDVFNPAKPEEDNLIGRWGDRLHRTTQEGVIRRALLFQVGDRVQVRHIRETERYLRAFVFLKDARIDPEELPDGSVRAWVWVRDAWTLKGTINYKLLGGQQTRGLGIQDQNLLGTGKTLAFSYLHDPVRETETFAYGDPQVLGSAWTLSTAYQKLSDGSTRQAFLQRPYTSLDTPWSGTLQATSAGSTYTLYDRGATLYTAHSQLDTLAGGASAALWHTEAMAWRPGFLLVSNEAAYGSVTAAAPPGGLPVPNFQHRRLQGPALTLSFLQDRFRVYRDLAGMDTPEDYNLGWTGSFLAGEYLPSWSSTERAFLGQAALSRGWGTSDRALLLASASTSGRKGPAGWDDALADVTVNAYWKETPRQITAAHLALDRASRPDPEDILYVGALQGLRGYPNWLHPGDGRWLMTVEQRMLTDQRWFGVLRLGYVAFADLGGIHRLDGTGWSPVYADVGGGLRFGDLKSSLGRVVLITVAVPVVKEPGVKGWQLAVGNLTQF